MTEFKTAESIISDPRTTLPKNTGSKITTQQIISARVFMRRAPKPDAACETEILFGTRFDVYKEVDKWAWGQVQAPFFNADSRVYAPGYIGWIPKEALGKGDVQFTHIITALHAPIFAAPDIKSPVKLRLNLNAAVCAQARAGLFLKIEDWGYIHDAHVSNVSPRGDFLDIAERHIGLPYIWGGLSTQGLDCSGLVKSSLQAIGRNAPRDADQQEAELGLLRPYDLTCLERGDLIFWKGHVGIMQDAIRILHANAFHMCVTSESLWDVIERIKPQSGEITAIKRMEI